MVARNNTLHIWAFILTSVSWLNNSCDDCIGVMHEGFLGGNLFYTFLKLGDYIYIGQISNTKKHCFDTL